MIRVITAWCIGLVLLAAFSCIFAAACTPTVDVPSSVDVGQYAAEQVECVMFADARPAADTCRKAIKDDFCARWPHTASCPNDGGAE